MISIMNLSQVDEILKVFHSNDWSKYYDFHNESWKKNVWLSIGNLEEFSFIKKIINQDLNKISEEYFVSDWITFLIYKENDFFGLHKDDNIQYGKSEKKILYSGGYLLNDKFEGGEFLVNNQKIQKNVGELFFFDRKTPHEVTKIEFGRGRAHALCEELRREARVERIGRQTFLEALAQDGKFVAGSIAADDLAERPGQFGVEISGLAHGLFGELSGSLDEGDFIEERERLHRRVGAGTLDRADFAAGGIEEEHRGRSRGAFPDRVERAAPEALAHVGLVVAHVTVDAGFVPDRLGHVRLDARAALLVDEQAGGPEGLVADDFGG